MPRQTADLPGRRAPAGALGDITVIAVVAVAFHP
jgi:hypothetical protein